MTQPSGRTAEEILDYADPNHPTDFWRKQAARRQLFDAICSEVIGGNEKHPKGCHNWLVGVCDRTVRNELRTELRQRLRVFFGQPTVNEKPNTVDVRGGNVNWAEGSGKDGRK